MLVHPGGPFWKNKDDGAWSIPKGIPNEEEDPESAARREFFEETGFHFTGKMIGLPPSKQRSGKIVHAWAMEGDLDTDKVQSNTFELEWPPKSGKKQLFPEVDRAEWFDLATARRKIIPGQMPLLDALEKLINS